MDGLSVVMFYFGGLAQNIIAFDVDFTCNDEHKSSDHHDGQVSSPRLEMNVMAVA